MRSAALLALLACVCADLDYSRVHLVDHAVSPSGTTNFLFRGNMPTNSSSGEPVFALAELLSMMAQRAAAAGLTLPADAYVIDVSLNNIFDGSTFAAEEAFWKSANEVSAARCRRRRARRGPRQRLPRLCSRLASLSTGRWASRASCRRAATPPRTR
jgi:hypothetical protein